MKTATLPSIRVDPELRATVESLLQGSETLTEFVENAVRETVAKRHTRASFLSRGIASLEVAKSRDEYINADVVVDKLRQRLETAKTKAKTKASSARR